MAERNNKSIHCVRDLRDAPLEEFRLPDDKREWKHVARNRQALANFLATYADGNGSRVYPGEKVMTSHFGWSRGTTFRVLDDLEKLGLQKRVGRHGGSRGTAVRQLDVASFRARFGVSNSPSESQTQVASESQTRVSESQTQTSESQTQTSESHTGRDTTVHSLPPRKPSNQPSTSWEGWLLLPKTTDLMGIPTKNEEQELQALASKESNGFEYLKRAVSKFRNREQGFVGLKKVSPWRLFLQQSATAIAIAKQECLTSHEWLMCHDAEYYSRQEASIERQTAEIVKLFSSSTEMAGESLEDFMGEN